MDKLHAYSTFEDKGYKAIPPQGYKKIRTHLIYDCKHDGRHKARMVADGHLTDIPLDSIYSGVISLRGIQTILFLGELNGLESWATDVCNAYLEAKTKKRFTLLLDRNLVPWKDTFWSLSNPYMVYVHPAYVGMSALLIVFETWDSFNQKPTLTFGCVDVMTSMSILAFMLMTLLLLHMILRRSLTFWKPSTILS
jgi:hypothetical protein